MKTPPKLFPSAIVSHGFTLTRFESGVPNVFTWNEHRTSISFVLSFMPDEGWRVSYRLLDRPTVHVPGFPFDNRQQALTALRRAVDAIAN